MLERLAESGISRVAEAAGRTLRASAKAAATRRAGVVEEGAVPRRGRPQLRRQVFDSECFDELPGELQRREGEPPSGDLAVDRAYDGAGLTWQFFHDVLGRNSVDANGMTLTSSVHYGSAFSNAIWNGYQMMYGDGDGTVFGCFTSALEVIAHEITHGVTQFTAQLVYQGEAGALNESFSDVFGIVVKHWSRRNETERPNWLIGESLLLPPAGARALRDMENPGTAFRDNRYLGDDLQVGHYADFYRSDTDNGGVHINSGIPNRAFVIAATAIGGETWGIPARIWYTALTGGPRDPATNEVIDPELSLKPDSGFKDCAALTILLARALHRDQPSVAEAVAEGWLRTGVITADVARTLGVGV